MRRRAARSACAGLLAHAATLVRAATAGLGAFLAVVHRVLGAFVSTGLADVGAECADRLHMLVAARHRLNITLSQASSRAVVAGGGALIARIDTSLVLLMSHQGSPS